MIRRVAYCTCPFCEATCGLELHLEGRELALVRGGRDDVFSRGYLRPEGSALRQLAVDPERLRAPSSVRARHGARATGALRSHSSLLPRGPACSCVVAGCRQDGVE